MTKVLKSVGVVSVGKIALVVYGCLGFFIGVVAAMVSVLGGFAGMLGGGDKTAGVFGMFFGFGAVIILPVFYGGLGALMGMLMAAIYNLAARAIGGIEFEIVETSGTVPPAPPR